MQSVIESVIESITRFEQFKLVQILETGKEIFLFSCDRTHDVEGIVAELAEAAKNQPLRVREIAALSVDGEKYFSLPVDVNNKTVYKRN